MLGPGVYPASVTAFAPDGKVDLLAMARLLAHFEAEGCRGVVLAGTNGEGPSLSAVEKRDLFRAMATVRGKLEIIAGVATASLDEAIWLCNQAAKDGAIAALVMPPGYFREATEDGIGRWFEALMDAVKLPILAYNLPQRTGITLTPALMARLAKHARFGGLKDSSGNRDNLPTYREAVGADHVLFVGDETLLQEALACGWTGTISGAANVAARWLVEVIEGSSRDVKFEILLPTLQAIRKAPQPATHKAILEQRGILPSRAVRLPLLELIGDGDPQVLAGLASLGLVPAG